MVNLFKNFGKGFLYILVLPVLAVALAVYGVVALFIFVFLAIKGLFLFFTGRSLYGDLPEDIEAKKRLGIIAEEPEEDTIKATPSQDIQKPDYQEENLSQDSSTDPFYVPEYLKPEDDSEPEEEIEEPEPEIEPTQEEQPSFESPVEEAPQEEDPFEAIFNKNAEPTVEEEPTEEIIKNRPEQTISIENSQQNATILEINAEDEEEEEDNSGIDIDYE